MSPYEIARTRLEAVALRVCPERLCTVRVVLALRLASEANARGSWHAGAARARLARAQIHTALRRAEPGPLPLPVTVRITRVGPRRLDDDNLARACKALRDGVADWLEVDDGDPRISWHYAQAVAQHYRVVVTVERRTWELAERPDATVLRVPAVDGLAPGRYEWPGLVVDVMPVTPKT